LILFFAKNFQHAEKQLYANLAEKPSGAGKEWSRKKDATLCASPKASAPPDEATYGENAEASQSATERRKPR
jgi:hypothetical protein